MMVTLQLGSSGDEVRKVQQALIAASLYKGLADGDYGGGTLAAVRMFQQSQGLQADGKVGPETWRALMGDQAVESPHMRDKELSYRCLALTGAFETGAGIPGCFCGLSGDFDGQGISLGVLQWNLGQGSLQPLFQDMIAQHETLTKSIFGEHFDALKEALMLPNSQDGKADLLEFARSIQHPVTHQVFEPWRGYAKSLGRMAEFQEVQVHHAGKAYTKALELCEEYDLRSGRAVALMFDIVTQNGSIKPVTRAQIMGEFKSLPVDMSDDEREVRKLRTVANRRAEASNPRWVDDVRRRKLCIANGEGVVHGIRYDLESQFGIGLGRPG